jgi:S1-C subfamily serine protease
MAQRSFAGNNCSLTRRSLLSASTASCVVPPHHIFPSHASVLLTQAQSEAAFARAEPSVVCLKTPSNGILLGSGVLWTDNAIVTRRESLPAPIIGTQVLVECTRGSAIAYVAGTDPNRGLTALLLERSSQRVGVPISLSGGTSDLRVGQAVLEVARDVDGSFLSTGVVSSAKRDLNDIGAPMSAGGAIQTDCSWRSSASRGAALVDSSGALIGLLAATYGALASKQNSSSGLTLALPLQSLTERVPSLLAFGEAGRLTA